MMVNMFQILYNINLTFARNVEIMTTDCVFLMLEF